MFRSPENEDLRLMEIKKEIARLLGVSLDELERMIERIKAEAPQLITDKIALLILIERKGITSPELLSRLLSEYSLMRLNELERGMRGVNVLGRIIRVLEPVGGKEPERVTVIIDDGVGRALVTFQGRPAIIFRKLKLTKGDIILVRSARVTGSIRGMPVVLADEKSELSYVDETDLQLQYGLSGIPFPPPPYSVSEVLNMAPELLKEGSEFDIRGVLIYKFPETIVTRRRDGRELRKRVFKLADETDSSSVIRVVAWESAVNRISKYHLGDVLILEGCSLRETLQKNGTEYEVHIGNLTSIRKEGVARKKIAELKAGDRCLVFGVAVSNPTIREYTHEGKQAKMATVLIADESGVARLVVWDEKFVEQMLKVSKDDKIRVFGRVREPRREDVRVEIHVSRGDEIVINPQDFPEITPISFKEVAEEKTIVRDFSELEWGKRYNIAGRLLKVERRNRRLSGIVQLSDDAGRVVTVMVWENPQLVEYLQRMPEGSIIELYNVRTPKEGEGEVNVIFAGERTEVRVLAKKPVIRPKLLREAKPGESGSFIGTVVNVVDVGYKIFCDVCGALAIEKIDSKYICEFGHETDGMRKEVARLLMDDDKMVAEVFLERKAAENIGIAFIGDRAIEEAQAKLIGKELVVFGDVKEAPATAEAQIRIFATDVTEADEEIISAVIEEYSSVTGEGKLDCS